jgi:pimeloyl-ACP methyl ester carboxylesterase
MRPLSRHQWVTFASAATATVFLLVVLLLWVFRDDIWQASVRPSTPYQVYVLPQEPDYSDPKAWLAFGFRAEAERAGEVAVFYIGPTSAYSGQQWNAAYDDEIALARWRDEFLASHAGPFLALGRVFSPAYRQATVFSFTTFREDARAAIASAYPDIARAFAVFLTQIGDRPFVIAGVGQGGLHALRLIEEEVVRAGISERLVAAYLTETAVSNEVFAQRLAPLEPCATADATQCVVSWVTAREGDARGLREVLTRSRVWNERAQIVASEDRKFACVNPLLWNTTEDYAPARLHRGAAVANGIEFGSVRPAILPRETSAQCVEGVLMVETPRSSLLRMHGFGQSAKTPTFNLFYADIAENVIDRVDSYMAQPRPINAAEPAQLPDTP